jgi:energy-coupling factor transporter ATP-binding protein EcfA2
LAIKIKVGDRWTIIGATGSGKTVLSRSLISTYVRATNGRVPIVILDTKMQGDFDYFEKRKDLCVVVRGDNPKKVFQAMGKKSIVIWRPDEDDHDMYNEFFKLVYYSARNNGTASISFIDELSSITTQSGKPPRYYDILLKQGRGMHNGLISLTQSPSYVPANLIRQTTHLIRMHLSDDYDTKKLAKIMGKMAYDPPRDDYGFWYRECSKPLHKSPAMYFEDFRDFIGIPRE